MNSQILTIQNSLEYRGKPIETVLTVTAGGISVLISGGDLPHIGAVTIIDPDGHEATTVYPGHRDDAVSRHFAHAIFEKCALPVTVSAGIHYDHLTKEGIAEVLGVCEELLAECLKSL